MLSIITIPLLNHPQSMRWSTVLYSCMFGLSFMAYTRLLTKSKLMPIKYLKILKMLILAYALTLLIQQFCVLFGIPIFNISNYDPNTPWKLNSLAAEPSHTARIVALLMYSYITVTEIFCNGKKYNLKKRFKTDQWLWLAFIWIMITMGSGTAFLFLAIVLFKIVKFKNFAPLSAIIIVIVVLSNFFEITVFERTYNTAIATVTFLNEAAIINADHSAAMRILPIIVVSKTLGFVTLNDWFGHGIDYTGTFLSNQISGLPTGLTGGGLFQLWIEYGLLTFLIFLIFSFKNSFRKDDFLSLVFWFLLVFLYGVNSQIVWLCLILLYSCYK